MMMGPDRRQFLTASVGVGSVAVISGGLGRLLRPKADGRSARFYTVVSRDTLDTDYAQHRQRFLAEQGYAYRIVDAEDVLTDRFET